MGYSGKNPNGWGEGGGVIEGQGYEIFKGTDEKRMRKFQRGSFKKIARKINVEFL